jgi:folate-binding protein YgfZ
VLYVRNLSSRARLQLTGADRVRFLHGMVTNDIEALAPGAGCHAAMLTPKGKMLADLVVYCEPERLVLELDGALGEKIHSTIEKHVIMDDVEVARLDGAEWGVYGDEAAGALGVGELPPYHFVETAGRRIARTPELGVAGYHVFGERPPLAGARELTDEEFEILRVEAGTPLYGRDMGEDRLPIEAGVTDAVSFTKGCYLGQEVIARATNLGHINRKLVGLRLSAPAPAGAKLSAPARAEAGVITSSVVSPRFGAIALGYLHRTLWEPGTEVVVEGGATARVCSLPFQ